MFESSKRRAATSVAGIIYGRPRSLRQSVPKILSVLSVTTHHVTRGRVLLFFLQESRLHTKVAQIKRVLDRMFPRGLLSIAVSNLRQSSPLPSLKQPRQLFLGLRTRVAMSHNPSYSTSALLSPEDVREVQIPVPWGHISGKWWGDVNAQPVVGLHGRQDNANTFDRLAPMLNVPAFLALDAVGHGRSSHYPVGQCYHLLDDVVNIRRVARHFKWDKLTLIGHSIGSCAALSYAGYFPDAVDKLVSLDCVRGAICQQHGQLAADTRAALDSTLQVEERLGRPPPGYKYDDIVDLYLQASHGSLTRDSCKVILDRGLVRSAADDGLHHLSRDPRMKWFVLGAPDAAFLSALCAQLTCAVLSVRATQGFTVGGDIERGFLAAMRTGARMVTHADVEGTHHVHLNDPARVATLINTFLRDDTQAPTAIY